MEEKMVKHIYIIIFVFFGSIFMNACLNIEPKGGGYMIVATRGSQISKSQDVQKTQSYFLEVKTSNQQ